MPISDSSQKENANHKKTDPRKKIKSEQVHNVS